MRDCVIYFEVEIIFLQSPFFQTLPNSLNDHRMWKGKVEELEINEMLDIVYFYYF